MAAASDHLGLVEAVDRLGQGVVIAAADAADRRLDASVGETFGVADRNVLRSAVRVVNETAALGGPAVVECLFERVQNEAGMGCAGHPPAHDPAGEGVDDEGDIDEALPCRHVREIRHPQGIRAGRLESAVHPVRGTRRGFVADRGAHRLATRRPIQAHLLHQSGYRAARHIDALPPQLPPDFPHPIDLEIRIPDPSDSNTQLRVAVLAGWRLGRIGPTGGMGAVG